MPTPPSLVAVDLGASSGRVLAGRLEAGRLTTHEAGRFPNRPVRAGGRLHWDVLALWAGVQDGLRAAARAHGPVASVGIDTWAVDYGLLDVDGDLLGNPVHYRDGRTAGAADAFARLLDPAAHYTATGSQVQAFNTVYQLLAAGSAGGAATSPRAADRLLLVPDLLGRWLSGTEATEVTNASTTGMLDPATRRWSPAVLDALAASPAGDVRRLLAPLVEPGTVLGPVLAGGTGDDGLAGAVHVAVGSHDTASAVAAVPLGDAPAAWISSGTWSLVGVELTAPVLTPAGRAANFTNELGVAGTVRYLRNVAGLWLLQESLRCWADAGDPQDLPALLAAADDVPALRTVVDVDDPAFTPPGDMPARIAAAARRTGQPVPERPAEVARCVLDSLALAYRRAVRTAVALSGRDVEVVHVVGGGARNALLCRLTADATGLPVVAGPVEATAIGNLLTQALALGELSGGLTAVREVVRASTELVTHHPRGTEQPWARAEERLWP